MSVKLGFTDELVNTQYAPLAAIFVHYQQNQVLQPLEQVENAGKERDFSPTSKIIQLFLSILAGCDTLSEVNPRLKQETALAKAWGCAQLLLRFGAHRVRLSNMIGVVICGWIMTCLVCLAVCEPKQARKGISAIKKHIRTPVGAGKCNQVPGNDLV